MKPAAVGYARANDLQEAVALLTEHGTDAKLLAGGQSLVPMMSFRLARPSVLVDINRVGSLDFVQDDDGAGLLIGAMTRQRDIETSPLVAATVPLLPQALRHVGHVTNRNRGTIGGSLAHADPAAELPALVTGLGGEVVVEGPAGPRTIAAEDFFVGPFATAMAYDEVLTAVRLPRLPAGTGFAVEQLARRHGDLAVVGLLAAVHLGPDGSIDMVRLAASGVGPTPIRLYAAEAALVGARPTADVIAAAADAVAVEPPDDIHAPASYRRDMVRLLLQRAVTTAIQQSEANA
ncbi:xanthine dehydrogenase family protein subunit M [Pseudonocardia sp. KRD-184]|uniref:Xanthine dehydrogenase family protein subunit M n=1 Tax=Pseudonocardia oceani TaxID=2792013 RepID=A0ABS6UAN5_9PSEU|nr:xanthine dehydrogenase family protein subunit M [Pseudonocardia oceani]MBW0088930.1 xanthine dehydrogenase family protein subunit M [Pseudonocardia oceani]MBW0096083.1 xanthine dehydrogenase family protein subunit M [Pseudonocardia oceani]MBW0108879.1 xanthine dehydrogenase family protein subunit M [Pseudonocardia oceani]MBW0122679.1 xanthine dehydrogenase family protein subunit M [Pseudonocardia oceani]MBW0129285.1 xanthine dehydrogenase family protein subunit M [Pseudonocardia oceani]